MMRYAILVLWAFFVVTFSCQVADASLEEKSSIDKPIHVTSDRLEADDASSRVRFIGNVVARQGDMVIYAQEMTILYNSDGQEVERVEISKDVRIVQGARVATAAKGTFYNKEGRIVLTGSAEIHQGEDFVRGDEITVFVDEERSIVSGEQGSRVNAVFHPKGEQQ